jgi:hypothetical protein
MSSSPASSAPRAVRRLAVLALFRRCLRSAARCPAFEQREMMRLYARGRFRDARGERDPARVAHLLAEGAAELATMDSYHAVRDAKERAQRSEGEAAAASAASAGLDVGGHGRGGGGAAPSPPPPAAAPPAAAPPAAAAAAAPPADAARLLDALGAALGAMDERALGSAAAQRSLQALSLHIDGAAAALAQERPGAALRDAQAAQRELQALVLLLRDAAAGAGGESAVAQLAALAPLSLGLRRILWALREAPAA